MTSKDSTKAFYTAVKQVSTKLKEEILSPSEATERTRAHCIREKFANKRAKVVQIG